MLQVGENREKVLVMKDEPDPVVAEATKLDHITLLLGIPARGDALKPLVILPRLTMPPLPADILDGYHISGTNSGGEILKNWVENQLVDEIQQRRNKYNYLGRCVIILDNHSSRDAIDMEKMQTEYGIDFLRLPPHSSAAMQPLDRCPNGELKKFFAKKYQPNSGDDATEKRIRILRAAKPCITTSLSGVYAEAGWMESGLYPFQPARILGKGEIIHDLEVQNPVPEQKKTRGEKFSNRVVDAGQFPQPVPIQVFEV
jgi:hypothetical protein